MDYVKILGVKVNNIDFRKAISYADKFIILKKPHQIATVNPEFIMTAQKDKEFLNILNNTDLNIPDGTGLLWASKILGHPLKERITGIDFMLALCLLAEKRKYPIFLLGGEHGSGAKAAIKLKHKFPKLIISGTYEGKPILTKTYTQKYQSIKIIDIKPEKEDPNLAIVRIVKKSNPKILFVAYGAPKQEKFIAHYKHLLNIPIMIGVGGSFDYLSGKSLRAPKLMQKIGLEWLWRVIREPKRIKRIITAVIKFPLSVLKYKFIKKM